MKQLRRVLIVVLLGCACNKAAPELIMPPAGVTVWNVTYKPATVSTCTATTPDSGTASMTADPSGTPLTLTDLSGTLTQGGDPSIVFKRDGGGTYSWTDPTGRATISFKFKSQTNAEGESKRLGIPADPCSATWPFFLAR